MDEYQMEFATGFGESYQNCPACGKEMIAHQTECFACGVVVDRFQDRLATQTTQNAIGGITHLTPIDIKKLDTKWKKVVVNYHDQRGHQGFIKLCESHGALPFAIYHYSRMLEIDKEDDIAHLMRRQALSRLTLPTETGMEEPKKLDLNPFFLLRWISFLGMFMGAGFLFAGLFDPASRNLIGLGVAFFCASLALYLYRRS